MKTLASFSRREFQSYKKETAFFLGNGINRYCQTAHSWKDLLMGLAKEHISNKLDFGSILDDSSVTYPEFFDIIQLSHGSNDETFEYQSLKRGFKEAFNQWNPTAIHSKWVQAIKALDRPLLTTNYDFLFEKSDNQIHDFVRSHQYDKRNFRPLRTKKGRAFFTPFYPWHNYYSHKKIAKAPDEFAIWHVHGFCEYPSSIRLGLIDYMRIGAKAHSWLHKVKGNPFHKRENLEKWVGINSWLDVFINNHLLFVGIDLGVQETSLRWLLLERAKLYRRYPKLKKKAWYVIVKGKDKFPHGKRLFFEKLDIELVEANSFKQVYETFAKRI